MATYCAYQARQSRLLCDRKQVCYGGGAMSDLPKQSLLLDLENAILALEGQGWDENSIFAFCNMIMKGYITNGTWTPEYLEAAAQALQQREQSNTRTVETPPLVIVKR